MEQPANEVDDDHDEAGGYGHGQPHREIAIVDDNVILTNGGFSKRTLAFLPYQKPWEMGNTLIQLLNSKKF